MSIFTEKNATCPKERFSSFWLLVSGLESADHSPANKSVNFLKADWISNFGPITWLDSGHEYDFNSVMHYSGYACSNSTNGPTITFKDTDIPVLPNNTDTLSEQGKYLIKVGLNRDLNPGPLAPKARIIPLDH